MGDGKESDVYKAVSGSQERFAFFILAASASAIAFALVRTEAQPIREWGIPIGIAIALWALSFWSGAEHILVRQEVLFLNLQLLKVEDGSDPVTGTDISKQRVIADYITKTAGTVNNRARLFGRTQYWLFLLGAIVYTVGHIMRMAASH